MASMIQDTRFFHASGFASSTGTFKAQPQFTLYNGRFIPTPSDCNGITGIPCANCPARATCDK